MLDKVREAIKKFNMLDKAESVTVALSGGADSVALLHALKALGYNICALHVNHCLRGEESDRDEAYVRDLCVRLGVELDVYRVDVADEAKKRSMGLEECGREIRYELLGKSALRHGGKIATAHTLSDNAETVLMNMARGCALSGLTGIPPVRGNIVRPLIFCTRNDVESYCAANALEYVTDSSNLTDDYSRNRVRHITVPSLETVNSSFVQSVGRMTSLLSDDEDFIETAVRNAKHLRCMGGYPLSELKKLHSAIVSRLIIDEYRRLTGNACSYIHVQRILALLEKGQGKEELPGNTVAVIRKGIFSVERKASPIEDFYFEIPIPCRMEIGSRVLKLEKMSIGTYEELKKNDRFLFKNTFDCDIMFSNPAVRNRRAGDRLRQAGRGVTKELRRLMSEKGIPEEQRSELLVLADEKGIIWAEGFGIDESRKINEKTENVVVIKIENRN